MSETFPGLPEPGIHVGVPFEQYRAWPAINNGALGAALVSMAHFRRYTRYGLDKEPTPQMRMGSLVHSGRFEPLAIIENYWFLPANFGDDIRRPNGKEYDNVRSTTAYKELLRAEAEKHIGKTMVTEHEFRTMRGMVAALERDAGARHWLSGGEYEVSILAQDPITGLWCKGRIDCLHKGRSVADLKTADDISDFGRSIRKWGYDRQLAFYGDMLGWLGEPVEIRGIVAQERNGDFLIRSGPLSEDSIEIGQDEYRGLLNRIAECQKSGVFPGYDNPKAWFPPSGAARGGESVTLKIGGKTVEV